tara:strand:- start:39 stop:248 length:210 start_codon:yes stop_codon:yes gene_type:complete
MGRAIEHENDIDFLKREIAQLKTAFTGLSATVEELQNTATTRKHVDLHEPTTVLKKKTIKKKVVEKAEA